MTSSETDSIVQQLYHAEHERLLRYFGKKVGRDEAADLAQEVFMRLLRRGTQRIENPRHYLSRCARNLVIERARRKRREGSIIFAFDNGRDCPAPPEQAWRMEEVDARWAYRKALLALPRRTRRIFFMHRLAGKTHREIAAEIGIGEAGVIYHMTRALARCRRVAARANRAS